MVEGEEGRMGQTPTQARAERRDQRQHGEARKVASGR